MPSGTAFGRIHFLGGLHPVEWHEMRAWGPLTSARFDHHPKPPRLHPGRAISYVAPAVSRFGHRIDSLATCVREVYHPAGDVIDVRLNDPWFSVWVAQDDITLLDVVDSPWVARVGGNAAISSGSRAMARRWSASIHRSYVDVQGIYYESATLPLARSVALFERARSSIPPSSLVSLPLSHPLLRANLEDIADKFDMALV